ncbi:hypothetical protein EMPS_07987 [Entomortierella parvispora]|uniref:Uncharacterized protein n=1 Tax=Entomortierella parvispora TaxID=205924 RepID=A0A9P3HFB2_9FUNG|nr:hypothetical protein EMPS_07987 [Entomortierella parvispora]
MADVEMEDIIIPPRQLSNRQMAALVSLWKLSHYRQAPWSTWSILYSQRRPKNRSRSPMICFDTKTYELLRKQQDEQLKAKQLHQHQIWQHVQDRLAEQNKALEKELAKADGKKVSSTKAVNGTTDAAASAAASAAVKRSIKWNLEKNITKRFDKNLPITLVPIPAVDTRPVKSALKVRTHHTIHNPHHKNGVKGSPSSDTKKSATASTPAKGRKQASDFF